MAKQFTFDDFLAFTKRHDAMLRKRRPDQDANLQLYVLARLAKLTEETGEVADAILHYFGAQRNSKQVKNSASSVGDELADVYIVLSVLAHNLNLDVYDLLEKKVRVLEERHKIGDV